MSECQKSSANPVPLGMNAFALTLFVFSLMNAGGLVDIHASKGVVMGLATFYGGLGQVLAGMWEFKNGNTFGATLFTSYGAFFLSMAALRMSCFSFLAGYTDVKDVHDGLGIYFLAWAMFSLWMTASSHRTTFVLVIFLLFVFVQFLMLSISEFTAISHQNISIRCQEAGGCFGVMAAFFAWYAAYAALLCKKQSFVSLPAGDLNSVYKSWGWVEEEKTN